MSIEATRSQERQTPADYLQTLQKQLVQEKNRNYGSNFVVRIFRWFTGSTGSNSSVLSTAKSLFNEIEHLDKRLPGSQQEKVEGIFAKIHPEACHEKPKFRDYTTLEKKLQDAIAHLDELIPSVDLEDPDDDGDLGYGSGEYFEGMQSSVTSNPESDIWLGVDLDPDDDGDLGLGSGQFFQPEEQESLRASSRVSSDSNGEDDRGESRSPGAHV